jgi:glucosamine-6-phosphate deaminase
MSVAAADHAAAILRREMDAKRYARIVAATGASQLIFLDRLAAAPGIDWTRVDLFHLDEYIGLPADHPASFRRYMRENLIDKTGIVSFHLLDVDADAVEVAERVGRELGERPVDVAFVGIGENSHLAFNDPPADFEATAPYLVVELDAACRRQQVGEGWFLDLEAVPRRAVSMSIRQILASNEILVIVPDERKAVAVRATLEGPITPQVPASILRSHANVTVYLDEAAASLLSPGTRESTGNNVRLGG